MNLSAYDEVAVSGRCLLKLMATEVKFRMTRKFCLSFTVNERNIRLDSFIYDVDDGGNSLLHLAVESSVFQVVLLPLCSRN